ncbi:MAG: hypothetical protein JNL08_10345 [Planctomycetes bacterium]|nr:hypothetical protein [Planctomycetota bacterium]
MRRLLLALCWGWAALPAQGDARGVRAEFVRLGDEPRAVDVQRLRLLSLAVERGETPSPYLEPGLFRATLQADVGLPMRDKRRFRLDGRGRAVLSVNGEKVLEGALRPGKPLETTVEIRLKKGANRLELVFESAAAGDGQVRLAWAGADFAFEPIAPELLGWAADDAGLALGAARRRGHALFVERRCARCHDPQPATIGASAAGELDATGPDLRAVGGRLRPQWLATMLRDPRAARADATMPRFRWERDTDPDDVAAWFAATGTPLAAPTFPDAAAEQGAVRFRELACVACHVEPGADPAGAEFGARSSLDHVAAKWHPAALVAWLQEPQRDHAHVRMPDFRLDRDDATRLAALLLRAGPGPVPAAVRGDAGRGRHVVQQAGCVDCHAVLVPLGAPRPKLLANLDADRGCLAESAERAGRAPDLGLDAAQRTDLRVFLPFATAAPWRRAPLDFVARHVTAQRCTACHALDGAPSTWASWSRAASAGAPLPAAQDPIAQGVPALTWVGAKLQPSWLESFLRGGEPSPRPWLHARMPSFARDAAALAAGLVREHGYGQADEPAGAVDAQLAIDGERLLAMGKGFGCVQCHALGDQPPVQVFEREGIELLTARRRLRHEYYARWLLDPTRLDPESRMPKFTLAKGRTALTDVLGGDAAQQFEAIWHHLGSRLPRRR